MSGTSNFGNWAQIASAAGAFAAVSVALFGPQLRRLLIRPRLDIHLANPGGVVGGDRSDDGREDEEWVEARWYHLRVSNPHRWSPVTAVRVFLLEIECLGQDGHQSQWKGEIPIVWRFGQDVGKALDLGFPRDCDLCAAGSDRRLRFKPAFPWGVDPAFVTQAAPLHLRLTLQARGLEADSRRIGIEIKWADAGWPALKEVALALRPAK